MAHTALNIAPPTEAVTKGRLVRAGTTISSRLTKQALAHPVLRNITPVSPQRIVFSSPKERKRANYLATAGNGAELHATIASR